jgi:hypothetical protein
MTHKTQRDVMLITIVLLGVGMYFLLTTFVFKPEPATQANIYYGNNQQPIVTIDFINQSVRIHYNQEGLTNYPFINKELNTITLLGDYEISGVRQEVVIGFDFLNQTVTILEEESPYNVCSNLGASSKQALICLPNAIRVEFSNTNVDFIM